MEDGGQGVKRGEGSGSVWRRGCSLFRCMWGYGSDGELLSASWLRCYRGLFTSFHFCRADEQVTRNRFGDWDGDGPGSKDQYDRYLAAMNTCR